MNVMNELPQVARVLDMSEEALLQEMMAVFLTDRVADSERRIGHLHLEEQRLRLKYGMGLIELQNALDTLEDAVDYETQTINGVLVLEAVSDTRAWEHIRERLAQEEQQIYKLQTMVNIPMPSFAEVQS